MELMATSRGFARRIDGGFALLDLPHPGPLELLLDTGGLDAAGHAAVRAEVAAEDLVVLPAFGATGQVWGVGLNYHAKARAAGRDVPTDPILFLLPSSVVAPPGADVTIPAGTEVDYEGELALVVGRTAWQLDEADAWAHVAGITAANDVTARDLMRATRNPLLGKGAPGSKPLGPGLRTLDGLDRDRLSVRAHLDGELVQDGATDDLIFAVPELLARLSRHVVLRPGDVVLTGAPPGTGQDRGHLAGPGALVEVRVADALPLVSRLATAV